MVKCYECGSYNIRTKNNEIFCIDCGLIQDNELIIEKAHPISEVKPTLNPIFQAGTFHNGRIVKSEWLLNAKEISLSEGRKTLQFYAERMKFSKEVIKEADCLFQKCLELDLTRGRKRNTFVFACMCLASRIIGNVYSLKELCLEAKENAGKITDYMRLIQNALNIKTERIPITDLFEKYLNVFEFKYEQRQLAHKLFTKIIQSKYAEGKNPCSIIGVVIYTTAKAFNLKISQSLICNVLNIDEKTLKRNTTNLL